MTSVQKGSFGKVVPLASSLFPAAPDFEDVPALNGLANSGGMEARFAIRTLGPHKEGVVLKLYFAGVSVPLSDSLPILERFRLKAMDHRSFQYSNSENGEAWVHEFALSPGGAVGTNGQFNSEQIEEALASIWRGESEADDFCHLVTLAGRSWSEATVFRAYSRYLRQVGFPIGGDEIAAALGRNVSVTNALFSLFNWQFNPDLTCDRQENIERKKRVIYELLSGIDRLEDERILRKYLMLIEASLRTNYFQRLEDGSRKKYLSIKFDSRLIDDLPAPRPQFEIFVYSPKMEGIHLRGGKVARGGIRWSDRHADFRTEIHGLLKAQMVKNVVIVPEGSKGGFVVKRPPKGSANMELLRSEGVSCYQTLIRGLLDLTDNVVGDSVVPPPLVVRRDDDDPYLVVAADKGTATFSDIANALSAEYGFWLGDAFASGGSAGYDHKKMGITARGAWESVQRHFREFGRDSQTDEFSVVGVGDMSGDVFGNGMLLSPVIRLVGAFDHRHIFIDPNPNVQKSYEERQRLFELTHSSWADFKADSLGSGGGIFERTSKSIAISEAARDAFGLPDVITTPNELISALLVAPVDLLWLGGIGTYIKASAESHDQVGDRACDAIRVDADQLRCKVIGEGANLGVTQRGRIQYALAGGRINTDAIDNAGGVNCSDHEVNIKILLNLAVKAGKLTLPERDQLLLEMTNEVASLVLRDNYLQSQALSVALACSPQMLDRHQRLIRRFERSGELDRKVAGLPDDEDIASRRSAGQGLTRPELSVLLAYTKISLYGEIIRSDLPDDPLFAQDLIDYFPSALREKYLNGIMQHPLRREIVGTMVVNSMVNRVGSGFVDEIQGQTGYSDAAVARAYSVVRDIFGLREFWAEVELLDSKVPADVLTAMHLRSRQLTEAAALWILRNASHPIDISAAVVRFGPGIQRLLSSLSDILDEQSRSSYLTRVSELERYEIPTSLARAAAALQELQAALDIVLLSEIAEQPMETVGRLYFAMRSRLGIPFLLEAAAAIPRRDSWESQAVSGLVDAIAATQRSLIASLVVRSDDNPVEAWLNLHSRRRDQIDSILVDLKRGGQPSLAMLVVAAQEVTALSQEQ
jgi:glutamate dehydrogenase